MHKGMYMRTRLHVYTYTYSPQIPCEMARGLVPLPQSKTTLNNVGHIIQDTRSWFAVACLVR